MEKKHFTIEEANHALKTIKPVLYKVIGIMRYLDEIEGVHISFDDDFRSYSHMVTVSEQYYKLSHELYKELNKLLHIGCIVKDPSVGLVDFYSLFDGREIFLCYSFGEEDITAWHELNDGAAGRKPISLLTRI